jgi:superfamily II DNA or RNA helicase
MTTISLRNYQRDCVDAVRAEWAKGHLSTMAVLATGAGKTEIGLSILSEELAAGNVGRILFLVHTIELSSQPLERIDRSWPEFFGMTGVVQAEHNDVNCRFVLATWQSLARGRLEDLLAFGPITHLVLDECHRSVSDGISGIVQRLRQANPAMRTLGLTATPVRSDKSGLRKVFDSVAYKFPISKAIKNGALVPFNALGIALEGTDISSVRETENGWDEDELGDVLSAENVLEIVYTNWQLYCKDRLTIGFTASVRQAETIADYFNAQGICAAWICGETDRSERRQIISRFKRGEIRVLFNVFVLVEGFDAPETSAVMMIAPTKSDLVYTQRLGRGLRLYPNKSDCVVLDFAPVGGRNIVMAGDVLGLPREVKKAEAKAERQNVLFAFNIDEMGTTTTIDPSELIVKVLDLLGSHYLAWYVDEKGAVAGVGEHASLFIELPNLRRMERAEEIRKAGQPWLPEWDEALQRISSYALWLVDGGKAYFQGYHADMESAKVSGDQIAENRFVDVLGSKDKSWRRQPATEKQLAMLDRLQVKYPPTCKKGQAAQLITQALAYKAVEKAKRQ